MASTCLLRFSLMLGRYCWTVETLLALQRLDQICNDGAVAGYLNAILVIPNFHYHSIWRDPSEADEIYKICSVIETPTQKSWAQGL